MTIICRLATKFPKLWNIVGITRCPDFRYENKDYGYKHRGGVAMFVLLSTSVDEAICLFL